MTERIVSVSREADRVVARQAAHLVLPPDDRAAIGMVEEERGIDLLSLKSILAAANFGMPSGAVVQADGGRLQFAGQAFRCDVPPPMQAAAAGLAGQPVVVGVRPQSLQLEPAPGALTLPLQVDVCEYLGTETVLGCTLRGRDAASLDELGTITLVVPGRHSDRVGTSLQAYAPLERLFAFEPGGHGRSLSL